MEKYVIIYPNNGNDCITLYDSYDDAYNNLSAVESDNVYREVIKLNDIIAYLKEIDVSEDVLQDFIDDLESNPVVVINDYDEIYSRFDVKSECFDVDTDKDGKAVITKVW